MFQKGGRLKVGQTLKLRNKQWCNTLVFGFVEPDVSDVTCVLVPLPFCLHFDVTPATLFSRPQNCAALLFSACGEFL
eukprot:746185-Amphidinium_carterae.1